MLQDFVRYPSVTSDTYLQCFCRGCTRPCGCCSSQCRGTDFTKLRAAPSFWVAMGLTPASMLAQLVLFECFGLALIIWFLVN